MRDILRTPSASLMPSGQRSSSGKKKRAASSKSHVALASRPQGHCSLLHLNKPHSPSDVVGSDKPAVADDAMTGESHVYLTRDGRISMAGINTGNVQYVADAMHAVTAKRA